MPCLVVLIALAAPRLAIVLVVIFSDYIGQAYQSVWVPLLGFFFLPLSTLTYAWAMHSRGGLEGLPLVVFIIAVLVDLGVLGEGSKKKHRR